MGMARGEAKGDGVVGRAFAQVQDTVDDVTRGISQGSADWGDVQIEGIGQLD